MLNIFVLLVSLNFLPPWASLLEILISVVNTIKSVGKLVTNLKKNGKSMMTKIIFKTKPVWNVGGLKQTYRIEQRKPERGAYTFHPPKIIMLHNIKPSELGFFS